MRHVVCYSGGEESARVAVEVVRRYGKRGVVLLNHDINPEREDADIKRFKREVARHLGLPVTYANIGGIERPEDIPDQFDVCVKAKAFKVGMGTELCTSRLKTEPFLAWLKPNVPDPSRCLVYYGFEASEPDRIERRRLILGALGYRTVFPLAEWEPTIAAIEEVGVARPSTYQVFKHANCVGCLKAGKQHWYVVFCLYPLVWAKAKWAEGEIGYSIMKGAFLKDLEGEFSAMREAGVLPTELVPSARFWADAKRRVRNRAQFGSRAQLPMAFSF